MQSKELYSDPSNVEPWELTAYALHELDEADRVRVERYLEQHPAARDQMLAMQHVAQVVRQQLSNVAGEMSLEQDRAQKLFEQMIEEGIVPGTHAVRLEPSKEGGRDVESMKRWRRGRWNAMVLTGLAASGLAMFVLRPYLANWKEVAWGERGWIEGRKSKDGASLGNRPVGQDQNTMDDSPASGSGPLGIGVPLESEFDERSKLNAGLMEAPQQIQGANTVDETLREGSFGVNPPSHASGREESPRADNAVAASDPVDGREVRGRGSKQERVGGATGLADGEGKEAVQVGEQRDALGALSVVESTKEGESSADTVAAADGLVDSLGVAAATTAVAPPAAAGRELEMDVLSNRNVRLESDAKVASSIPLGYGVDRGLGGMAGGGMGGVGGSGGMRGAVPATPAPGGPPRARTARFFGTEDRSGGIPSSPASGLSLRSDAERQSAVVTDQEFEEEVTLLKGLQDFPEELRQNVPSRRRVTPVGGDRFEEWMETPFTKISTDTPATCLSTFSIDVDTASYSKLRQMVLEQSTLPMPGALRIEELVNYFEYDYPGPKDDAPFAAHLRMAVCPWNLEHRLVRVAVQAKKVDEENRPAANLVFLIDVSGSMAAANKLPLVKRTLMLLTHQLREQDRVAIVVYAGAAGCVLPSTLGANKDQILASIGELQSGGSTNGGQGIELAYRIAKENFVAGGVNRVILCTDGDFNVGVTGTDQLVETMQENAKSNVFLTCLGYGIGNYNDAMMEQISNKGNGTYGMIDNELEARRMMVEQLSGTLMTVAKDVKLQIEFNPSRVSSYRLIGYENRRMAHEDFSNDRKDAGEIGAGHRVTALYEIVPVGSEGSVPGQPKLRYGAAATPKTREEGVEVAEKETHYASEWLHLSVRSKQPEAAESTLQEFVLRDEQEEEYVGSQSDMDWAASVAEFGLLLRQSKLAPGIDWERMVSRAQECVGDDAYRRECLAIMQRAKQLAGR